MTRRRRQPGFSTLVISEFSPRADMLRVLLRGARGERFSRYPEGVFTTPRDLYWVYASRKSTD